MRHPRVAAICVVLDHDEPATRPHDGTRPLDHVRRVGHEVEAVRGQHAIERADRQRLTEVGDQGRQVTAGEPLRQLLGLRPAPEFETWLVELRP